MAPDHQFDLRLEEIEITVGGAYLGMWDASAVVDVIWDEVADSWVWDVADWRVHDDSGAEISLNSRIDNPIFAAAKRILDAQIPSLDDEIDAAVASQMPAKPQHNEHRLHQSEFV